MKITYGSWQKAAFSIRVIEDNLYKLKLWSYLRKITWIESICEKNNEICAKSLCENVLRELRERYVKNRIMEDNYVLIDTKDEVEITVLMDIIKIFNKNKNSEKLSKFVNFDISKEKSYIKMNKIVKKMMIHSFLIENNSDEKDKIKIKNGDITVYMRDEVNNEVSIVNGLYKKGILKRYDENNFLLFWDCGEEIKGIMFNCDALFSVFLCDKDWYKYKIMKSEIYNKIRGIL